ncbi:MAG TPA: hypothetical protein VFP33_00465 [Gallionella sp.]|nr:hypothetical protein [Gallionella sp.]
MKIDSSNIGFTSQHSSSKQVTADESMRAWGIKSIPSMPIQPSANATPAAQLTEATLSAAGKQAAAQAAADAKSNTEIQDGAKQTAQNPRLQLLIGMIEAMTGQKVKVFDPSELQGGGAPQDHPPKASDAAQSGRNQMLGWGLAYDKHERIRESEQASFSAQGTVKTSDGQEIQFNLSVEMNRDFVKENNTSIRQGDAAPKPKPSPKTKDPLVINFNGTAAQLTDTKFSFDLDTNGKAESISFVGAGSGFLALDKNGNGAIDNGSELFGTKSGNGFADLAAYDSDGNRWIDANDAVYSKLRVWSKDARGKDSLSTLAEHNVGALYLGNAATPFDLKNAANDLQGVVRSTGVYMNENGSAGTLQQVDLVV